jgi:hypothetical protein
MTNQLLEKLAEQAHNVWVGWTKEIAVRFMTEPSFQHQREAWEQSWIPYSQLPESQKALDRNIATKYLEIVIHHYNKILEGKVELKFSDEEEK